jgi:hypothetical protein
VYAFAMHKYLGVYSLDAAGPGARQKQPFFIWKAGVRDFVVQQLDSAFQPVDVTV